MLDGALSAVAVGAIGVWGLTYAVHVGGYGWRRGTHNETVTDGPGLSAGGVILLVC